MIRRALLLGLVLALPLRAAGDVIDDEALDPCFKEFKTRFDQVNKGALKVEEFVQYYQQRAQAKGTPKDQAINAYFYAFVLFNVVPNSKESKDAKREFQRAADAGVLAAYLDLARIAEKAGDRTEADRLLRRALELRPAYVRAVVQQGQMAHRAGELERAKGIYEQSLDIKPTVEALSALVIVNTSLFRKSYDDKEKERLARQALAAADAVVTLEPDRPELRLGKAEVYLNLGRMKDAIDYLEELYAGGTLSPEIQLRLLMLLRQIYQAQGNVEGVKTTVERLLKCETLRPEERSRIIGRRKDLDAMGRHAFTKWGIEDAVQTLHNEGLSVEERLAVLRSLWEFITGDALDVEELRPLVKLAWDECFRVLVDGTPELVATQLRALRNTKPPPRLMAVLVHFVYPSDQPEEVREEGVRTVAACAGVAAIPAIYFSLQDDSGRVVHEADSQLSVLCERRSPLGGGIEAYTIDQRKQARRTWTTYFHSEEGSQRLAKAFAQLGESILKVQPDRTSAPMIDHAANVLLDDDIPWPAWAAAYDFLVKYWGKEFRPVDRRGKAVEPFEREPIVREFKKDYSRPSGGQPDDTEAAPPPKGSAGMAKGK